MKRAVPFVLAALTLAACDKPQPVKHPLPGVHAQISVDAVTPVSPTPPALPPPTTASALPGPPDRDPLPALAFWRTALEEHRYADARSVWGDNGAASGLSPAQFTAAWDKYRIIDITVGKGNQEGAAGSSFYEAPVTIDGLTRAGKPYHLTGTITLRRVNDVDGATPEQLRWHIERSTLRP